MEQYKWCSLEGGVSSINAHRDGTNSGHGLLERVLVTMGDVGVARAGGPHVLTLEAAAPVLSMDKANRGELNQKYYKFSRALPKCLFSRDVIIIITPLPGAVTITI